MSSIQLADLLKTLLGHQIVNAWSWLEKEEKGILCSLECVEEVRYTIAKELRSLKK